ncbi:fdxB [Gossypium australe]|uniref:FdxB n=1 Tax=Gossypium australe TaxID=47621 RepID=A0A5B6XAW1_9ROSI|nr:fdxB [Gossypium australe]
MLTSRLSRVGFRIVNELSRGWYVLWVDIGVCQEQYLDKGIADNASDLRSVGDSSVVSLEDVFVELLPETRAFFQGAIFQKHPDFSTLGSNNTSGGGDEQKETISVTFVSKDGEEIPIRVPIGTSMLEAAHQNDIELEGKAYDIFIFCS